ncbi:hypothetical protein CAAN3_13S01970 [[Candida] anglica]
MAQHLNRQHIDISKDPNEWHMTRTPEELKQWNNANSKESVLKNLSNTEREGQLDRMKELPQSIQDSYYELSDENNDATEIFEIPYLTDLTNEELENKLVFFTEREARHLNEESKARAQDWEIGMEKYILVRNSIQQEKESLQQAGEAESRQRLQDLEQELADMQKASVSLQRAENFSYAKESMLLTTGFRVKGTRVIMDYVPYRAIKLVGEDYSALAYFNDFMTSIPEFPLSKVPKLNNKILAMAFTVKGKELRSWRETLARHFHPEASVKILQHASFPTPYEECNHFTRKPAFTIYIIVSWT